MPGSVARRRGPVAPATVPFTPLLITLLGFGLLGQVLMISEFCRVHPAAEVPWGDGEVYWAMAARIAGGDWMGDTPFLSAPLYPYLLGVLRWLGVGFRGVYAFQAVLHLATVAMVALASRRRFGSAAGLLAAALYLLLSDAAVSTMRVVANVVQVALAAATWWAWVEAAERPHRNVAAVARLGVLVGLLALAAPQMLLFVPLVAGWLLWRDGWGGASLTRVAVAVGVAAAVVAPATVHNWIVGGELIPITAHSGVTLRHGNQPGALGVLMPIPGLPPGRVGLHEAAARAYQEATGRPGSWREVDRFFQDQVLAFWREDPPATLALFATKATRFITGWAYDDTEPVELDRRFGLADWTWLAPIRMPWLMGLALVGVWAWRVVGGRRLRELAPEVAMIGVPLLAVILFYYAPRYRLPVAPPLCGLAAYGLVAWRRMGWTRWPALVLALSVPVWTILNARSGFEVPDRMLPGYRALLVMSHVKLADREAAAGALDRAEGHLRAALAVQPDNGVVRTRLEGVLELRR